MAAEYKIRVYNRSGVLQYELIDYRALAYTKAVNEPGMGIITLDGRAPIVDAIELDWQIEVYRRDLTFSLAWYCDFYGFFRDSEERADDNGIRSATLYCPGQMSLLSRANVAYAAGAANRTEFTADPAETIAKTLVTYNATSGGTTGDGRERDVTLPTITVEADGLTGNVLDYNCAKQNLLSALQEVAEVGGGDFDLAKNGAAAWEFQWFDGQLGSDLSGTVAFSLSQGNMANPVLRRNTLNERTVAIVGGQGEEGSRAIVVRTGANYDATFNAIEVFVDARQMSTTDGLNAAGDNALANYQARYDLSFDVLQIPSTVYGRDYALGDLVTAVFGTYSATKKVASVAVEFGVNGERLNIGMKDV
jgi:hypothetical protein